MKKKWAVYSDPDPHHLRGSWKGVQRTPEEHRAVTARLAESPEAARPAAFLDRTAFGALLLEMGFQAYTAYLASPLWAEIRRRVLKKSKRCADCGSPAFQVHHEAYTRENVSGVSLEYLAPLCRHCHEARHRHF